MGMFDWLGSLFGSGGGTDTSIPSYGGMDTGISSVQADAPYTSAFTGSGVPSSGAGGGGASLFGGGGSLNDVLKGITPALGLATTGASLGAGIYGMTQAADQRAQLVKQQKQQAALAAPAAQAGGALTAAGSQAMLGGPLPQQLESQVEQFKQNAKMKIRDYLAKAGISDSTMATQFDTFIEMQADTLRSQLAQNLLQSGYSGIGAAMGPSGQVSATAQGLMGSTSDTINAANKSIALLMGQTGNA